MKRVLVLVAAILAIAALVTDFNDVAALAVAILALCVAMVVPD